MTLQATPGRFGIDWSRPWLAPLRELGQVIESRAAQVGLLEALNEATRPEVCVGAGRLRFVEASSQPAGEAYEAFIARTAGVPTRDQLHDFFNALIWLSHPTLKRHLNELQAGQIAQGGVSGRRGAVRDALTLFDENAALLRGPSALLEALRARDWHTLFVARRSLWADARLVLFGHALLEKLTRPRKAITAHVWVVDPAMEVDAAAPTISAERLAAKPFLPLPVLGVPLWWPANEDASFYADPGVFRRP